MTLRLQMIGTGNAFAKKYFNNNALIYSKDYTLLIDCGITAPLALHQLGVRADQINGIFITHLHADHVGGLEEIAYQTYYIFRKKLDLFVPEKLIETLWENSLKAGLDNGEEGCTIHTYFQLHPVQEHTKTQISPGLDIEIMQTEHVPNKLSYSMFLNDHMFYSADVQFSRQLIDHVYYERQCKYILHDCQLNAPGTVHATLDELLTLPPVIQQRIQLMHYNDNMEDFLDKTGNMSFLLQHEVYEYF